jgi:hypothetical protein
MYKLYLEIKTVLKGMTLHGITTKIIEVMLGCWTIIHFYNLLFTAGH